MSFKKVFLGLSLVPFLAGYAHSHSDYTYVGLGLGASYAQLNTHANVVGTDSFTQGLSLSKGSVLAQVEAGHVKHLESVFLMGEGFFRAPENEANGKTTAVINGNQIKTTLRVKRRYTAGLSAKVGKRFESSKWSGIAGLGLLMSEFDVKMNVANNGGRSLRTITGLGVAPTVGLIWHECESMPIRFDYSCEIYRTLKAKKVSVGQIVIQPKINPLYHVFMVSVGYKI